MKLKCLYPLLEEDLCPVADGDMFVTCPPIIIFDDDDEDDDFDDEDELDDEEDEEDDYDDYDDDDEFDD